MRKRITDDSYKTYLNSIKKYIVPRLGKLNLTRINRGHINKLYKFIYDKSTSGVKIARTVLKTSFDYAIQHNLMDVNPVINAKFPKELRKTAFGILNIVGLRRCEINGLKYSDIDYIHRTIKILVRILKR